MNSHCAAKARQAAPQRPTACQQKNLSRHQALAAKLCLGAQAEAGQARPRHVLTGTTLHRGIVILVYGAIPDPSACAIHPGWLIVGRASCDEPVLGRVPELVFQVHSATATKRAKSRAYSAGFSLCRDGVPRFSSVCSASPGVFPAIFPGL